VPGDVTPARAGTQSGHEPCYDSLVQMKLAGFFLIAIMTGCGPDPLPSERLQSRIINGTIDTTHSAVVALVAQGADFCTGTVIGPRTVVSAGHCQRQTGYTASDLTVFFGNAVGGAGTSLHTTSWTTHPEYKEQADGTLVNDVSVIVLAQDAPVEPMAWQSTPLPNIVGKTALMVGYGVTNAAAQTGSGTRRQVNQVITAQDASLIYYGDGKAGTCQGDSGGPTFLDVDGTPTVIAVTSFGDQTCVQEGANTRLDTRSSFIAKLMPLTVSITSPADRATVDSSFTLSAKAGGGAGIATVEVLIDGICRARLGAAPFDFNLTVGPGNHNVEVLAHDKLDSTGTASIAVHVGDAQQPSTGNLSGDPAAQPEGTWTGGCGVAGSAAAISLGPLLLLLGFVAQRLGRISSTRRRS
jgi:V8-like Glu-specific endopeptidase